MVGLCLPSYFLFSIQHFPSGRIEEKKKIMQLAMARTPQRHFQLQLQHLSCLFCLFLEQFGRKKREAKSSHLFILSHFPSAANKKPTTTNTFIFCMKFLQHISVASLSRGTWGIPPPPAPCTKRSFTCTNRSLRFQLRDACRLQIKRGRRHGQFYF